MSKTPTSKTTPQQDAVLIALTREYPRTIVGMAEELNIPKASIRRTLRELKAFGYGIRVKKTSKDNVGYYGRNKYTLGFHAVL